MRWATNRLVVVHCISVVVSVAVSFFRFSIHSAIVSQNFVLPQSATCFVGNLLITYAETFPMWALPGNASVRTVINLTNAIIANIDAETFIAALLVFVCVMRFANAFRSSFSFAVVGAVLVQKDTR